MKKKLIYFIIFFSIIALICGFLFMHKNNEIEKNNIVIIDATYACDDMIEEFYSDNDYIYYFPCTKSSSIYVKYANGNKELLVNALQSNKVTIKKLESAGLKFYKKER